MLLLLCLVSALCSKVERVQRKFTKRHLGCCKLTYADRVTDEPGENWKGENWKDL